MNLDDLRPMSEFDPDRFGTLVYDALNDQLIAWETRWATSYDDSAIHERDGFVNWDGLILTGWKAVASRES